MSSCTSLCRNKSRVQSSGVATFSAWRKYAAHGGGAVVQVGLLCKNSLSSRSHVRISSAAARMTKANCEVWTGVGLRSCWSSRTRGHFSKRPHDDGQLWTTYVYTSASQLQRQVNTHYEFYNFKVVQYSVSGSICFVTEATKLIVKLNTLPKNGAFFRHHNR